MTKEEEMEKFKKLVEWSTHAMNWMLQNNKPENQDILIELFRALMKEHQKWGYSQAQTLVNEMRTKLIEGNNYPASRTVGIISNGLDALFEANYKDVDPLTAYQRAKDRINATNI